MSISVSGLYVYPIKSLRGISLDRSAVEPRGLRHDRRWMLVDLNGLFLTQRKIAKMALFNVAITPDGLAVDCKGRGSIEIPAKPEGEAMRVQVWSKRVRALVVSEAADRWFSDAMGMPCRLVYMPESAKRRVYRSNHIVGFADANPILVASQSSLDDLNARMAESIPIQRFRPNIVLQGPAPFEEDHFKGLTMGAVHLTPTWRCGRCIVTTIDIETAKPSQEPLRTLNTFRHFTNKVCFGMYYAAERLGEIHVGMECLAT